MRLWTFQDSEWQTGFDGHSKLFVCFYAGTHYLSCEFAPMKLLLDVVVAAGETPNGRATEKSSWAGAGTL